MRILVDWTAVFFIV